MPPSSLPPSPLRHSLSRRHKAYSPYLQSAPHFHRKCGALFGIVGARREMFSFDTKREPEKCIALRREGFCLPSACRDAPLGQRQGGVFRFPPPYLWTPPTPQCNNCDRRQRRKQGEVVGAAASKTRVPPKARSGCWEPQPVSKGYTPLTILKKKSKHKKASAAPVGAIALTLFSLLHL